MGTPSAELAARLARAQARGSIADPRAGRERIPPPLAHDAVTPATASAAAAAGAAPLPPPLPHVASPAALSVKGGPTAIRLGFQTNNALGLAFDVTVPWSSAPAATSGSSGEVKWTIPVVRMQTYAVGGWLSAFSSWKAAQALPGSILQRLTPPAPAPASLPPASTGGSRGRASSVHARPTWQWLPSQLAADRYGLSEHEFIVHTWQEGTPVSAAPTSSPTSPASASTAAPGGRRASGAPELPTATVTVRYTVAGLTPATKYRFQVVPGVLTITGTPATGPGATSTGSSGGGGGVDGKMTYSVEWGTGSGETGDFATLSDVEERARQAKATAEAEAAAARALAEIARITELHKAKLGEGAYSRDVFQLRKAEAEARSKGTAAPQPTAASSAAFIKRGSVTPAGKAGGAGGSPASKSPAATADGSAGVSEVDALKAQLAEVQGQLQAAALDAAAARAAEAEAIGRAQAAQAAAHAAAVATLLPAAGAGGDLSSIATAAAASAGAPPTSTADTAGGADGGAGHRHAVSFLAAPQPAVTEEVTRTGEAMAAAANAANAADEAMEHLAAAAADLRDKLAAAGATPEELAAVAATGTAGGTDTVPSGTSAGGGGLLDTATATATAAVGSVLGYFGWGTGAAAPAPV